MKIFQKFQIQYEILGISRTSNQLNEQSQFNERILFGILLYAYSIFSQFMYLFRFANGVMEYVESISFIFGAIMIFTCFVAIVFNSTLLFENIDNMEKLVDASEIRFTVLFIEQY